MDNHEAIASLKTLCHTCKLFPRCAYKKPECFQAIEMAISALQEQDSKRKVCDTCKHNPPSKKWPCVDCDMREPADRWEQKDVPDTNAGDMLLDSCPNPVGVACWEQFLKHREERRTDG